MKKVLDATAIRSGIPVSGEGWYTTPGVVREVRLGKQARDLELLLDVTITTMNPGTEHLKRVRLAASGTNDLASLSDTDIEILALAHQLDARLFTDDYAVQNVAAVMGIEFTGSLEGIKDVVRWRFRCRGCGRYFDRPADQCPVCGSFLKRMRGRSRPRR